MIKRTIFMRLLLCILSVCIILPVLIMLLWVFTERWAWPDLIPQVFSTRSISEIWKRKEELIKIFASSIFISAAVAMVSVIVAVMTARALAFYQFFGRSLINFMTILPFMVPATVFAMGIQLTFIKLGLNNTVIGVILAHVICSLPYAIRLILDGTQAVGVKLEEQARVLGAPSLTAFRKVTLPVLAPVIFSAAGMAYIVSFSQYFLTLMIGGGNIKTFTIIMVPYLQGGDRNIACIYSTVFLLITLAVFAGTEGIIKKYLKTGSGEFYV